MKRKKPKARPRPTAELLREGVERHKAGALAEAAALYQQVLAQQPEHPDALNLLGLTALEQREPMTAARLIARAVAAEPRRARYHLNLGNALVEAGLDDLGVEAYQNAANLGEPEALHRLGLQHLRQKRPERALEELRRLLAIDPAHAAAGFLVAGLTGGHVDAAAPGYVAGLFDTYAAVFDDHLVGVLGYQVPGALAGMVTSVAGAPARAWTVLDLGCGTGLCGAALRDVARRLVGTDLSPRMIERATARAIYDELYTEDLVATLARESASVDLIVAADVFIYVGALEAAFAGCAAALRPGGLFAFSIERWDGDGFRLHTSFRYAHSDAYVRELGERSGFTVVQAEETTIRLDEARPIPGVLYLLRKGEA